MSDSFGKRVIIDQIRLHKEGRVMLREGSKVKVNGRTGTITFVNKALKAYQVMFNEKYGEIIPFKDIDKKAAS